MGMNDFQGTSGNTTVLGQPAKLRGVLLLPASSPAVGLLDLGVLPSPHYPSQAARPNLGELSLRLEVKPAPLSLGFAECPRPERWDFGTFPERPALQVV